MAEKEYLADVDRAGGSFVVRASASINPVVLYLSRTRGVERAPLCALSRTRWLIWMSPSGARWNPQEGHYTWLVTNLARDRYGSAFAVAGGADVQGMEVVCESSCVRYEQCGDCARAHLDGNCGVDSETLLGSNDAGTAWCGDLDAQGGDVRSSRAGWAIPCSCDGEGSRSSSCAEKIGGLSGEQRGSRSSEAGP